LQDPEKSNCKHLSAIKGNVSSKLTVQDREVYTNILAEHFQKKFLAHWLATTWQRCV